jgi:glucose/arabinose dehydrogenase
MKTTVYIVIVVLLLIGGYFGYEYIKQNPPDFLVKLLTSQNPPPPTPGAGEPAPLVVPEEFSVTVFAKDVPGARVITRDQKGTMLVSSTQGGKVFALPDLNGDGKADEVKTVLEELRQPHGLAVICSETGNTGMGQEICTLYVAETHQLVSYQYNADTYTARDKKVIVGFPAGDGHYTRTILQHPDGKRLLVSVGSSCNVCNEQNPVRASVQAIDLATGNMTTFASGLRNTVFMTTNPIDGKIWGTDNGRDLIGDDIPPDEVNIIEEGKNYGWPLCYGQNIHDTDFDKRQNIRDACAGMTPSRIDLQAHSAALGLGFVPEEGWPEEWRHDLIVAYHGSWNRSEPTGYKVVRFDFIQDGVLQDQFPTDFVTGFLAEGADEDASIGRPVDVRLEPGGIMYLSDDKAGAIYKVSLKEPAY